MQDNVDFKIAAEEKVLHSMFNLLFQVATAKSLLGRS